MGKQTETKHGKKSTKAPARGRLSLKDHKALLKSEVIAIERDEGGDPEDALEQVKGGKRKRNSPAARQTPFSMPVAITPDDFKRGWMLRNTYSTGGRPPVRFDEEECQRTIDIYIGKCFYEETYETSTLVGHDDQGFPMYQYSIDKRMVMRFMPSKTGIAVMLGSSVKSMEDYRKSQGFSLIMENFLCYCEELMRHLVTHGGVASGIAEMLLNRDFGYVKQSKVDDPNALGFVADVLKGVMDMGDNKRREEAKIIDANITPGEPEKVEELTKHIDISPKQQTQSAPMIIEAGDNFSPEGKRPRIFYQ